MNYVQRQHLKTSAMTILLIGWFLCWIAAAVLNAFMDRVSSTPQFNQSIFFKNDPSFWCLQQARPKTVFGYKVDAWHLAKSTMLVLLAAAGSFLAAAYLAIHRVNPGLFSTFLQRLIWFFSSMVVSGAVWNIVMPNFYGKVFKQRKFW